METRCGIEQSAAEQGAEIPREWGGVKISPVEVGGRSTTPQVFFLWENLGPED